MARIYLWQHGYACHFVQRPLHVLIVRMQDIVDAMREAIPKLEFTVDCFNVADLNTEVVELVLRDIPLNATELDACRAVHAWAQEFFGIDSDEDTDTLPEDQASDDLLILPPEDRRILKHIDLGCVCAAEIREVCHSSVMSMLSAHVGRSR